MFFYLSGILLTKRIDNTCEFLKRKVKRLLYPYFVCGVIIIIWNTIRYRDVPGDYSALLLKRIMALLYGNYIFENNTNYIGTLWFLVALFNVCLIFALYKKVNNEYKLIYLSVVIIAGFILCYFERKFGFRVPWCIDVAMVGFFFSICGYELRNNYYVNFINLPVPVLLIMLGVGVQFGIDNIHYMQFNNYEITRIDMYKLNYGLFPLFLISALLICSSLCLLCERIFEDGNTSFKRVLCKITKPICWYGEQSLLIMMFHYYVIERIHHYKLIDNEWIVLIVVIILSGILAYVIKRFIPFIYDVDKIHIKNRSSR